MFEPMADAFSKRQIYIDSIVESYPVFICFLGNFGLLKAGQLLTVPYGGKTESLLACLVFRQGHCVPRETLYETLWPNNDYEKAMQSLNSLIHYLHRLLGDALQGDAPVIHEAGYYWLNVKAGIGIDIKCFDTLVDEGDQKIYEGDMDLAVSAYRRAASLYRGDIQSGTDVHMILERERLRVRYLNLLERLANYYYSKREYALCMDYARGILVRDPCREEAHRLMMRCFINLGDRAQAMRQYTLCQEILRAEFDAVPEPTTTALFNQLRLNLES